MIGRCISENLRALCRLKYYKGIISVHEISISCIVCRLSWKCTGHEEGKGPEDALADHILNRIMEGHA